METEKERASHLANGELAAYVDRGLPAAERARVESHLAECDACRAELVEVTRLLRSARRRRRRAVVIPAAAAAAAAVVILLARAPEQGVLPGPVVRAGGEGVVSIAVVSPAENETLRRDSLVFVWRSAGPDVHYRLTVTDEAGAVLWSEETSDTTLFLPPAAQLRTGGSYFWYVDALLADGRSQTTGVRRLRMSP